MSLISLKAYADKVGLAPVTVRKRILRGVTKGVKIGRDWFVDEDEELIDHRISSGKYTDWRKPKERSDLADQISPI